MMERQAGWTKILENVIGTCIGQKSDSGNYCFQEEPGMVNYVYHRSKPRDYSERLVNRNKHGYNFYHILKRTPEYSWNVHGLDGGQSRGQR